MAKLKTTKYGGEPFVPGEPLTEDQFEIYLSCLPNDCCAKCRHWLFWDEAIFSRVNHKIPVVEYVGECKRYPPIIHPRKDYPATAVFPRVNADCICGEFVKVEGA